ncbi:hypothetical protein EMIHUDRAFT_453977 [Emiliania huxleyi CCMP1516]|uniref:Mut7-C RNAse domain-containing protein n=2 Tax=Emiliania huxleyi TaxID=2903 RepID=A0A0D3HYK7_EMIH1|nr:hypothetical protein EMIHUDRAFT_453977 [Emiliania huxleyi CCMP1516]EOD04092.1 hypothetical protein EMIHUDRAFT_453977 [Emiliania huxleyi CCMP1516]|eukprot:XP_005756521.1 hypothetical protein EMIHUDRAFT_453977 [Emiliania huxleyi CCMP1516]
MTLVSASTLLQQHLLAQGAPRAAARLARAPAPPVSPPLFSLDAPIHLCDTPSSADALAQMLRRTLASANDTTLAFDAEWRPDGRGRCKSHPPSLLQLSTADGVWLVDLEAAAVVEHPERPLVLFAEVLRSESVRKLGFAVQGDLDRLQLRCSPRAGFAPGFALTARRVVDLREACNRTLPGVEPPCAGGLAAQLSRWAGVTLDKAPPRVERELAASPAAHTDAAADTDAAVDDTEAAELEATQAEGLERVRVAVAAAAAALAGAVPGRVPPVPLRAGVRVLCHPSLGECAELWGSSGDPLHILRVQSPRVALPHLAAAAARGLAPGEPAFAWLPPPGLGLVVDSSLSVLARKLRMVGVDTRVAGEVIKGQQPAGGEGQGSPALSPAAAAEAAAANGGGAEAHMRSAALEGRLIVMNAGAKRAAGALPGAAYRLLATDASAQFAELLAVLELSGLVDAGGSRCGICNGDEWQTLRPDEVEAGQVPHAVLRVQPVFYRCGACMQMFWPGDKYESTMDGLRAEGRDVPPRRPPPTSKDGYAALDNANEI